MRNKFILYIICGLIFSYHAVSQDNIGQADSLFGKKKYTEAYRIYDNILKQGEASEAMLMKMAFIREGLGDYVNAILFLNEYLKLTKERKALEKIRQIAKDNDLKGYEYSDLSFFIFQLSQYRISLMLLAIFSGLFLMILAARRKQQNKSFIPAYIFALIFLIAGFIVNNRLFQNNEGVILKNQTLLMEGPSAAADLVEITSKGHKIEIIESDDLWYKIRWDGQVAYVRSANVKPI